MYVKSLPLKNVHRCCCGRPKNQHGKLTTVQEENEVAEEASEITEGDDTGSSQDEAFEVEDRVTLVKNKGWFKCELTAYGDATHSL